MRRCRAWGIGVFVIAVAVAGCKKDKLAFVNAVADGDVEQVKAHIDSVDLNVPLAQAPGTGWTIDDRMTALMFAAYYGHPEVVELLLTKGAKPNLQNKHGDTALISAIMGNGDKSAKTRICTLLLDRGADVTIENKHGETALKLSQLKGNAFLVDLFRRTR